MQGLSPPETEGASADFSFTELSASMTRRRTNVNFAGNSIKTVDLNYT